MRKSRSRLDDTPGSAVFSNSEQSKNGAGEMVPLYAARVQDLRPDDVAVFKCGACGHTAELWPSFLITAGSDLSRPTKCSTWNGGCGAGCATPGAGYGVDQLEGDELKPRIARRYAGFWVSASLKGSPARNGFRAQRIPRAA